MEPLTLALRRAFQRHTMQDIRVFFGGPTEAWEPLTWRLCDELVRLNHAGVTLSLILPQHTLTHLTPAQRDELAALTAVTGAQVYLAATTPETEGTHQRLPRALEIGNEHHAICWAASHTDALAPTPHWGSGEGGLQFVRVYRDHPLAPISTAWHPLTTRELRSAPDTLSAIAITTELNGSHRHFGQRAWQRVCEAVPQLHQRLVGP
jgi:hypothetical protein